MLDSTVRFELQARGDRVALVLTHRPVMRGFETRTLAGWHSLLDALRARLEGEEPADGVATMRARLREYEAYAAGAN
jgi:hypothetical protein